ESLAKFRGRVGEIPVLLEGPPQSVVRFGQPWIELQRRLEFAHGLLRPSLLLADQSEIVMGLGVARSQPQGLFKLGRGGVVVLKQPVSLTQMEMGFWILGPRLERRLELAPGAQQIPSVSEDHSQRVMDLRPI